MSPQTYPPEYRYSLIYFCIWAFLQHTFISKRCLVLWCCRRGGSCLSSSSYRATGDLNLCKDVAFLQPGAAASSMGYRSTKYLFHAGACGRVCNGSLGVGQLWARSCQTLANRRGSRHHCGPLKPARCFILCYKEMSPPHQNAQAGTLCKRGPSHKIEEEGSGFLSVASKSFVQSAELSLPGDI